MSSVELPFYSDPWRGEKADAARAIWDWHLAVRDLALGAEPAGYDFELEAERVRTELATGMVDVELLNRVQAAEVRFGLPRSELAAQVKAAARLTGPIQFEDTDSLREFMDEWTGPVGRLLARLANVSGLFHVGYVDAMSSGFFLLGRLLDLPEDVRRGHLFIPRKDLEAFSVSVDQLGGGPPDEAVKKLLWKQCVRIRDYFARSLPLSRDLPRRYAVAFRRWWLGGLEMVNAVERRKYDLWSGPVELSAYHRAQARFQARFARVSFKGR